MCHLDRLLLSGRAVSRHLRERRGRGRGTKLGVGPRDEGPGTGVGALGGGEVKTGWEGVRRGLGRGLRRTGEGSTKLPAACHLAVGNDVANLAAVSAEV